MRYNVLLTDNSKEGIVINADTLREFFIELDNFMSSNCYYWDDILSIKDDRNEEVVSDLIKNTTPFDTTKKYKTILADPPWQEQGGGKIKRGADRHYPLMKTEDIKNLDVGSLADDSCWLYLWVTNNFLKDGLEVMEHWGFRYVTNFCWAKDRFGIGYYFRGQHELCLFGVKGNLKPIHRNIPSLVHAKITKHSKKPEESYEVFDRMSHEPRIELFARTKREGWDSWGNEV